MATTHVNRSFYHGRDIERCNTIYFCVPYHFHVTYHIDLGTFCTIALLTEIKIKQFRLLILLPKFIYPIERDETSINKKML